MIIKNFKIHKHLVIVALLWLFAPAAWYLMWQDKKYHSWFAPLLLVNGIVIGIMIITQSYVFIPYISALYELYGVHPLPFFSSVTAIIVVAFAVIQIIYGLHVRRTESLKNKLVTEHLALTVVFFTVDVIIGLLTGLIRVIPPYTFLPQM